jgi:predicted  nucleic acid-binding Zn-ribbon protein
MSFKVLFFLVHFIIFGFSLEGAFSQELPDEINFRPFLIALEEIESKMSHRSDELISTEDQLREKKIQVDNLDQSISELKVTLKDLKREVALNNGKISEVERKIRQLNAMRERLNLQTNDLLDRVDRLERRLSHLNEEARPYRTQINKQKRKIESLSQNVNEMERKMERDQSSLKSKKSEKSRLSDEIGSLKKNLMSLERKKEGVDLKIQDEKKALASSARELGTKRDVYSEKNKKVEEVKQQRSNLQKKLAKLKRSNASADETSKVKNKLDKVKAKIKDLNDELRLAQKDVLKLENRVETKKSRISNLETQIQSLAQNISRTKSKINTTQSKIGEVLKDIATLDSQISRSQSTLISKNRILTSLEKELDGLLQSFSDLERKISNMKSSLVDEKGALTAAQRELTRTQGQLDASRSLLADLESRIPILEDQIDKTNTKKQRVSRELDDALAQENQLVREVESLEILIEQLEDEAHIARGKYQKRKNLHDQYLEESLQIASDQTSEAKEKGQKEGGHQANIRARSNASKTGKSLGESQAKYWSLIRGEVQGYNEGYSVGFTDANNRKTARNNGATDGENAALNYIEEVLLPTFYEDFLTSLFGNQEVGNEIFLSELSYMKESQYGDLLELESDPAAPSQDEIQMSNQIVTSLDKAVDLAKDELARVEDITRDLMQPENVYKRPELIPYGKVNCSGVYKKLEYFIDICRQQYKEVFSKRYLAGSWSIFKDQYPTNFEALHSKEKKRIRDSLYNDLFDKYFASSQLIGIKQGKEQAYDIEYQQSYEQVHDRVLKVQTPLAKKQSQKDVLEWIKASPIITMRKIRGSVQSLRGGDRAKMEIDLKNISSVDLNQEVKLLFSSSNNILLEQKNLTLNHIEATSTHKSSELFFSVLDGAVSGEEAFVKVKAILPGDKYKNQRIEELTWKTQLDINPEPKISVRYDKAPNAVGFIFRKMQKITVSLSPRYEDLQEGYIVTLERPHDPNGHVILKSSATIKTGNLSKNQSKDVTFKYKVKNKAKGDELSFRLKVSYRGKILKEELLKIRPR